MRTYWIEADDREAWQRFLHDTTHDVYELPEYAGMDAHRLAARPRALVVERGSATLLVPLLMQKVPDRISPELIDGASPYGYSAPAISTSGLHDPEFIRQAWRSLIEFAAAEHIVTLFIRLSPFRESTWPDDLGPNAGVHAAGDLAVCNLQLSPAELERNTRAVLRREGRKATELGVRIVELPIDAGLETFMPLYVENMDRIGAHQSYYFSPEYFGAMRNDLRENVTILAAIDSGGMPVSAAIFLHHKRKVHYHLSGTSEAGLRLFATKAMLLSARLFFKSQGAHFLNLGGGLGSANDSLLHFKTGFGTSTVPYSTCRVVCLPESYRQQCEAAGVFRTPTDRSYFPAYRDDG